ncbi:FUSC family protein [Agathobaculum sp. NSJ-28]|uniref:FUSC family protein n=2 Tax=Agathobaculum TaxID=2048137 RepID=A0A923LYF8_9FIRM|nr:MULTISPECIES: FUSC family protein [Butyricicoccaceae]MBS6884264.1 FUSC family protein [Clostridiaceae bacterium]SCJ61844.1 Uncharacterised protein [uncultured Butyricicoccus sp.]MBC5726696.1 FUSC family protein [Agathobaculum faecis]MCU6790425.1 FUSC family protein [Agathobaculum ammoniilyticum]WOC75615.1 FUSC family protein [Intestinibacillus sp. NTUH-41-i26]
MNFYQAMQLDVSVCKEKIRTAATKSEKHKFVAALIIKDVLCVLFAIAFISVLNFFFGNENSSAAVVIFCILLMVRFVDFGYRIKGSMINFFVVFVLLTFSPCIAQSVNPVIGFCINFLSIGFIVISACHEPLYGSAGLYLFAYMFLYGNPVEGRLLGLRTLEMLIGVLICGAVFYINHRKKHYDKSFFQIVKDFSLSTSLGRWQFQVILGLSLGILVGELLQVDRVMWVGCACLTVLTQYGERPNKRAFQRLGGVVAGSLLFGIVYQLLPPAAQPSLGIYSGLLLGLCAAYHWKTLLNCFGALLMATSIFGLKSAIILRIANNIIGCCFGVFFYYAYNFAVNRLIKDRTSGNMC